MGKELAQGEERRLPGAENAEAAAAALSSTPGLWARLVEAWRQQARELLPALWARILFCTSRVRAARMLVLRFAAGEWKGLLGALARGDEAEGALGNPNH